MNIFLDDSKLCPSGWTGIKTYVEFIDVISKNKDQIKNISLDFDLSATDKDHNGLDICNFMLQNNIQCEKIIIHSTHPKADLMYDMLSKKYNVVMEEYNAIEIMKNSAFKLLF